MFDQPYKEEDLLLVDDSKLKDTYGQDPAEYSPWPTKVLHDSRYWTDTDCTTFAAVKYCLDIAVKL